MQNMPMEVRSNKSICTQLQHSQSPASQISLLIQFWQCFLHGIVWSTIPAIKQFNLSLKMRSSQLENNLQTCKCDVFSSDVAFKLGVDNEVVGMAPQKI
jgi:hypothetical protein